MATTSYMQKYFTTAYKLLQANMSPEGIAHAIRVMELRHYDTLGLGDERYGSDSITNRAAWRHDSVSALLHDVVEDSAVTLDDIERLFGLKVRRTVDLLTRRDGETYFDYIARVSSDDIATGIKLADLHDHLWQQRHTLPESLKPRYEKARKILTPATGKHYLPRQVALPS